MELSAAPAGAELMRRAVWSAVPGVGGRRPEVLPDAELVLRDVAVDRAHLARYDRVCGFTLSDTLPPTYPHILAFPLALSLMTRGDFPFPAIGTVHVGNRIEVSRDIDAGERLDLSVRAVDLRAHERGRQFDVRATATVGDEVVWRGVSTYLRVSAPKPGPSTPAGSAKPVERPAAPPAAAIWRVTPRVGTDYAAVSGDRNPIPTPLLGARLFGFRRPIAHGMWSMTRCLAALGGRLPPAYAVQVAFKLPVLLPATVAFSAARLADAGWSFALHDARSGRPHLTGKLT